MTQKILSIITQKGGVGKTTSTIHLGGVLAEMGYKVLLIDFDTQKNLTIGFHATNNAYTIENFLKLEQNPQYQKRGKENNISILSGSAELNEKKLSANSLKNAIKKLAPEFDFVLIDCPPKPIAGELTFGEIAITASDFVISPILADMYSIAGISTLISSISALKKKNGLQVELLGFFFNQAEERTTHFKGLYKNLSESNAKNLLFKSVIRKDINVIGAMAQGKTLFEVKPYGRASQDLRKLTNEILDKIK